MEVTLINLKNGVVLKNVKSNRLKEQEKLDIEKAEKEQLASQKVEEEKKTEELVIGKERKRLEEENKKLKSEIAKLSKEENTKLKKLNEKIKITYSYKFTKITDKKGQLIITNNAGFPIIKQNHYCFLNSYRNQTLDYLFYTSWQIYLPLNIQHFATNSQTGLIYQRKYRMVFWS